MIKAVLRAVLINTVALYATARYIEGFHLPNPGESLLLIILAFTGIHLFIKPILKLIFGPLNFLTFGLVSLILDVAILYGLALFFPTLSFSAWSFPGATVFGIILPAYNLTLIHSIIISAISINFIRTFLGYLAS